MLNKQKIAKPAVRQGRKATGLKQDSRVATLKQLINATRIPLITGIRVFLFVLASPYGNKIR